MILLVGNTLTVAIDSTVATLTGSQTLTDAYNACNQPSATLTYTHSYYTDTTLNGAVTNTSIKDEDDMSSDSASHLATQQSSKPT